MNHTDVMVRISPCSKEKCAARVPLSQIRLGAKLRLPVTAEETEGTPGKTALCEIVGINWDKRWFLCKYAAGVYGATLREAFCFVPEEAENGMQP